MSTSDIKPSTPEALVALRPGAQWALGMNGLTWHEPEDGQTEPTQKEIDDKEAELVAAWEAKAYARNRELEYPDTGAQFNKIYDDGIDKWKTEMVDPVKAKWPKDNSGPK